MHTTGSPPPPPQQQQQQQQRDDAQRLQCEGRVPHAALFAGVDGGVRKERTLLLATVGWTA